MIYNDKLKVGKKAAPEYSASPLREKNPSALSRGGSIKSNMSR